jgi:hypothetical protein
MNEESTKWKHILRHSGKTSASAVLKLSPALTSASLCQGSWLGVVSSGWPAPAFYPELPPNGTRPTETAQRDFRAARIGRQDCCVGGARCRWARPLAPVR